MLQKVEPQRSDYLHRKVARGRPYLYFRFPPKFKHNKPIPLPVDETSAEFKRQYDLCLAKLRRMEADAKPPEPPKPRPTLAKFLTGTIAKGIERYRASNGFKKLKGDTPRIYIGVLDAMKEKIGDGLLRDMDRDEAESYRDKIYEKCGSAQMADLHLTLLNNIWKEVRLDEDFGIRKLPNPTLEIERKYKASDSSPHLRWPEDVQDKFDETAPANLLLARHVLHYSVQRGIDAIEMKWTDYDGKGIRVWPEKTTKKDQVLEPNYHLLPKPLIRTLDVAKQSATSEYILVNRYGRRWGSRASLSAAIKQHLIKVGVRKPNQKRGHTMHGLRHTGASEISLLPGFGVKGIQSGTGQKSERMALHYSKQAELGRANAMMIEAWNGELERAEAEREARRRATAAAPIAACTRHRA
jgi:integrase